MEMHGMDKDIGEPKSLDRGPPPWRTAGAEADASHEADPPPWRRRKDRLDKELRQERDERRDRELQQEEHKSSVPAVASPEAQAPSAPLKPAPQDPPRVFAIGEKVRYWSGTHRKWVEAHVQRVNRDADGELLSYDLTARAQAEIARVKDASTAEDAPAPAARSSTGAGDEIPEAKKVTEDLQVRDQAVGDGDSHEARFENGEEVQYFSETKERWIDAVVEGHHAKDGAIVAYDLNCKKGVPAERLRHSGVQYKVGELVEYWSASGHRWMPAKVERLNLEARACDLDVKPGAPLNRVRKVSGTSEASASLLKAPRPLLGPILAHNVDVPPPPLACGFKAGDQVQYFSETKQRWVETLVLRMFELEGNICYDLDCKKGVSADKVRSSPRASQERYEVGEQVEYWSVSAGRWLPAKVQAVRLDLGRCDLDIKLAAPIGRIRRPIGHATAPKPVSVPAVPAVPAPEPMPVMPVPASTPTPPPARRRKPLPQPPAKPEPPVEMAVCLSEEEDEVPPMPHDLRKPLPPPPPMPLPLPVQAAQPTQEPTKPSETEAQKQDPEKRDASPSPSPAAKEPAEEAVRKSPEPEPVRQKSPSQDSSQESEEEEEEARKPARQDMEITRTPTPPRHVLQAAQQASQAYRSPVQLQGPDEPTSPADCIRVELDEESEPTERPPKEEDQAPEPGPPAAPAGPAAEQPLKRPREPSEHLDFEAPPTLPRSVQVVEEPFEPARPLREKRPKEKGRRRRRKHNHADAGQAEENGISKEARSDVLPTNGDEGPGPGHSRRRRRRRESDAPSPGAGKPPGDYAPVHEEPDARADHGGRQRRPARISEPTQPEQGAGTDETRPRPDQWPKPELQRGARRRIPPGATAKALPSRPRDVRDHDRGERNPADGGHREELLGACDLLGAAQDAMETVEWQRLVMEQEEAMAQQQDSEQPPRPRRRSLTPLARRRVPRDGRELGREGRPWSPRSERDRSAGQGRDLRLKSRSRSRRRNRQPAGRRT
ncbi:unnamed protein product [Symbiodinium natans]|uniref:Uncharacterized protein n=1 Tax=Symbiodinium natans TaxID=878477 RepID=A0A812TKM4_9DINO|nr:unnamed protein product [Symbiodinium natans]